MTSKNTIRKFEIGSPSASLAIGDADCDLIFSNECDTSPQPRVTIAIPTFNRPQLLKETLASAWAQKGFADYDIIVVDNASTPENVSAVLAMLREAGKPVRYYVNTANMGVFRNWNRCLSLARGEWVSILNDDDLLKPTFLQKMMEQVASNVDIDAIICRAQILDQRIDELRSREDVMTLHARVVAALRFKGAKRIRLTVKRLFWSNIAGSSLGCLYRRSAIINLGGFDPEDAPIADYVLNIKLASRGSFVQLREQLARVRLQVNETMKPDTLKGVLIRNFQLRSQLVADGQVPRRWHYWLRYLLAHELNAAQVHWHQSPDRNEVERALKITLPLSKARWMYLTRIIYGGV